MFQKLFCGIAALAVTVPAFSQPLSASEFQTTASFTDNFAGGASTGKWEVDPGNLAGAAGPSFVTSTPAGVSATVTTLNPVASSSDGGVMMVGNLTSTNGSLFGLDYIRCANALANGSGEDFTAASFTKKYRVVARMYLFSATDKPERWQIGPYGNVGGDLFRACSFYNTNASGLGPGFGFRGAELDADAGAENDVIVGTNSISPSGWRLMSLMIDASDANTANWRMAITVDANGDGNLNESDPLEYVAVALNSTKVPGTFGVFTVGEVNSDGFPLFVDSVQLFKPTVPTAAQDWNLLY